jgi:hypothetical protein
MNYILLKELMKQSETECGFDSNKFAELIVRECIEVANKNRTVMEIKTNTQLTADAIKKHFGVEE